jgi:hypothetical protein
MHQGIAIMFIYDKAFAYRSLIAHTSLTSKVAVGILMWAALIVAIGAVSAPKQALSSVDRKDIKLMSAKQMSGTLSRLLFLETDPAQYAPLFPSGAAPAISTQVSRDVEASMVNGHIQAYEPASYTLALGHMCSDPR